MCGICGRLNFDRMRPVAPQMIETMLQTISHRGPDGSGTHVSGAVGLGHRRLSIIDLNTGAQPMSNEDDSIWVVFNGEIYNFKALRKELEAGGHVFKTHSDTEVILHMYEEMGERCVTRFEGMFAFALWDRRREKLLLARDRIGIKPLYFTQTSDALIFASEIKAIIADPDVGKHLNLEAIERLFTFYYLPGRQTMFEGIFKLEPGHTLTVERGKVSIKQYWDLSFDAELVNDGKRRGREFDEKAYQEAVATTEQLVAASVRSHMMSDVPVGVLLSGGVDSTGVLGYAAIASPSIQSPLHTFTMGFSDSAFADERPYARMAAQRYETAHHEVSMSAADFMNFLPKYVWHMEEPVCEPPAVALYYLANFASQSGVKVLLSGEGGDEAFGGYQDYRNLLWLEQLKRGFGAARPLLS
ncbi:MAG: asnB, partial [Rhizobacter sp.]|nr:asnB [Rhizobacter sp.]